MSWEGIFGVVNPPSSMSHLTNQDGPGGISVILSTVMQWIFVVAPIIFLFLIVSGGYQYMTSGGDKEAAGKARARITYAIIGFAIIALAFLITNIVTQLFGIDSPIA